MDDLYPYHKDEHEHPYAFVFYNAAGLGLNFDSSNDLARHIFDDLKCGPPGSTGEPEVHYDALGGLGGPWRQGRWVPVDEPRYVPPAPAAPVNVAELSGDELAELKAQIAKLESVKSDNNGHSDETGGG